MKPANGNIWVFFYVSGLFASSVPFPFVSGPTHGQNINTQTSFPMTVHGQFSPHHSKEVSLTLKWVSGPKETTWCGSRSGCHLCRKWPVMLSSCPPCVLCCGESHMCVGCHYLMVRYCRPPSHSLSILQKKKYCKLVWPYEAARMREPGFIISLLLHAQFAPYVMQNLHKLVSPSTDWNLTTTTTKLVFRIKINKSTFIRRNQFFNMRFCFSIQDCCDEYCVQKDVNNFSITV